MKVILTMEKPRRSEGAFIRVAHFPFVIGRERGCSLRANIPTLAARQCALLVKDQRLFIKELETCPDILVNDCQIHDHLELHDRDRVKVGSLQFVVRCQPEPAGPKQPHSVDAVEEVAGGLLLAMDRDEQTTGRAAAVTSAPQKSRTAGTPKPPQPEAPDTAAAAARLLAKLRSHQDPALVARRRLDSTEPEPEAEANGS